MATMIVKRAEIPGTKYDRAINGAPCPKCAAAKCSVVRTLPWDSGTRVRYHVCRRCGIAFKSIEEN